MGDGATVIITQVDVLHLNSNQLYMDVLQSRTQLHHATATAKINVCMVYFIIWSKFYVFYKQGISLKFLAAL